MRPMGALFLRHRLYVIDKTVIKRSWIELAWDAFCLLSVVGIWPRYIEPHWLCTSRYKIPIPTLPQGLNGFKIAHFADLHLNSYSSSTFLRRVKGTIQALQPDLILFSGDLLTYSQLSQKELADAFFNGLTAPFGTYACLGNHDYAIYATSNRAGKAVSDRSPSNPIIQGIRRFFHCKKNFGQSPITSPLPLNKELLDFYASHQVTLLHNETLTIGTPPNHINITGLGDLTAGDCDPVQAFKGIHAKVPTIVLAHNPDSYGRLSYFPGDLFLFGHTHGGQINLPFIWTRLVPLCDRSLKGGLVFRDNRFLFTSRGVGDTFPFRWFAPPEITLFELLKEGPIPVEAKVSPEYETSPGAIPLAYPFQLENRLYNERTPRDKGAEKGSLYSHTGPFSSPLSRERSLECKDDFPTEMGITPRGQNE